MKLEELKESNNKNGYGIFLDPMEGGKPMLLAGPFPDKERAEKFAKDKKIPITGDTHTIKRLPERINKFMDNTGS